MNNSTGKESKIAWGRSQCIPTYPDRQRAFDDVERFILAMVYMRRRAPSRRNRDLGREKGATRLLAGDEISHQAAGTPISRAGSRGDVSDLVLLLRSVDSLVSGSHEQLIALLGHVVLL